MRTHPQSSRWRPRQAGFSMVEMLMTAFIMAVGILGLTMLMAMSLKGTRGGRSLSTAVLVGEDVMDRIEMQGRLSWLNVTDTNAALPSLANFTAANLKYVAQAGPFTDYFDINGNAVASTAAFYTVTTTRTDAAAAATGGLTDYTVQVQFTDQANQAGQAIQRTVTLTRRITHG